MYVRVYFDLCMVLPTPATYKIFRESTRFKHPPTAQRLFASLPNPIDAASHPSTGTRERVLHLSDPRTDHRNLGLPNPCLSGEPPSFSRRSGPVADVGGIRLRFRHACRWMAH